MQIEIIRDPCLRAYRQMVRKLSVINPQSALLVLWNILVELSIIYHFGEIPIGIFFTEAVYETQFKVRVSLI